MNKIEALARQAAPSDWIRGKAIFRNGRVHNLSIDSTKSNCIAIQAEICSIESYVGRITLDQLNANIVDWQCNCHQNEPTPCRHVIAVLLQHLNDIQAPGFEAVLAADQTPGQRIYDGALQTDVHILFRYQKQSDRILIIPRLIMRKKDGKRVMSFNPLDPDDVIINSQLSDRGTLRRDRNKEQEISRFFSQWAQQMNDPVGCLAFDADRDLTLLVSQIIPALPGNWRVLYDSEFEKIIPHRKTLSVDFTKLQQTSSGLLTFNISFHCDQLSINPEQLQAYINGQQKWLLVNGEFIEAVNKNQLRRLLEHLAHCRNSGEGELDSFNGEACRIADLVLSADEAKSAAAENITCDASFSDLLAGLRQTAAPAHYDIPGTLNQCLRGYQCIGINWLLFLRSYHLGGILADDMGLGKTIQVLAALVSGPRTQPSLIICPKTLLFNWLNEARRFVPELKTVVIQGSQADRRRQLRQACDFDLIITSYSLVQRDLAEYLQLTFECCILDEAQMIKNPETHLARNIKKIKATQRIALTGTPMENQILDLWSIFDFVMPGYLGTKETFLVRYGEGRSDQLKQRIKPFLLRRTKADVLPELPPKIEETIYTPLTQNQLALYQQTLLQVRKDISSTTAMYGQAQSRMAILAGLTRLRQICNHPGLLHGAYLSVNGVSGKLVLFDELMHNMLHEQHKILVFSQFTQMLAILVRHLNSQRIPHCYLDGQTRDRQQIIDRFNQEPKIPVFLISLKAGGFGLNLTAADTVILFDPWWNPMVEDQAADRVHRIGQSRVVTVYRLISQGTIEEKMERLQDRKRLAFDRVINQAANQDAQGLSIDDLKSLLDEDV